MTVRIDRAVTEVIPEPEATPPSPEAPAAPEGDAAEDLRWALERLRRIGLRTRAEGFDD